MAASFGDPGGARTLDPLIKSQLLYQLSYGVVSALRFCGANLRLFFEVTKFFDNFFRFLAKFVEKSLFAAAEAAQNHADALFAEDGHGSVLGGFGQAEKDDPQHGFGSRRDGQQHLEEGCGIEDGAEHQADDTHARG